MHGSIHIAMRSEKNMNGADDSIRKNHPEWLLEYSSSFILDPGESRGNRVFGEGYQRYSHQVQCRRYCVRRLLYPYEGTKNEDAYSQSLYKPEGKNVGDWRRENCNKLIADIYAMIQENETDREIRYRAFRDMGR